MRSFLIKISICIGIGLVYKLVLFILVLNTLSNRNFNSYYGYSSDKPRIILVGSSNLSFNYNYKRINNEFKDFDIIGCGLNEPSGFYATLNKLKQLKPTEQDIIIFCLPYSSYDSEKLIPFNNTAKQAFTVDMLKECFKDFPIESTKSALISIKLSGVQKLIQQVGFSNNNQKEKISFSVKTSKDSLYLNCWTNEDPNWFFINSPEFKIDHITKLHQYINNQFKSKVFYRYPVLSKDLYLINPEKMEYMGNNMLFINSFESSVYEHKFFFNQFYHLNNCGRELNTRKFISEIKQITEITTVNN